jgi:dTMP kinase
MNLRSIPRAAVGGSIKVARLPLDLTAAVIRRGTGRSGADIVVDRAEAAARGAAGTVLGDEQLKRDASRRSLAADERERADAMEAAAGAQAEVADQERRQREQAAERRRAQAAERARAKKQQAAEEREQKEKRAADAEKRRKEASERAAAQREEAIDAKAKRDRLEALETEKVALKEREEALTAADEAERLADAATRAKAKRKG